MFTCKLLEASLHFNRIIPFTLTTYVKEYFYNRSDDQKDYLERSGNPLQYTIPKVEAISMHKLFALK